MNNLKNFLKNRRKHLIIEKQKLLWCDKETKFISGRIQELSDMLSRINYGDDLIKMTNYENSKIKHLIKMKNFIREMISKGIITEDEAKNSKKSVFKSLQ